PGGLCRGWRARARAGLGWGEAYGAGAAPGRCVSWRPGGGARPEPRRCDIVVHLTTTMSHRRGSQLARWAATKLTGVRTVARRAGEVRRRVEDAGCSESGVRRMDATLAATGAGGVPGFIGLECRLGASLAGH